MRPLLGKNCSSIFPYCRGEEICSLSAVDEAVIDLCIDICTFLVEHFRCFVLQESITGLLPHLSTEGVLSLLALLEELGDFFETGIRFLFLLLGLLDVVEEEAISLIVDFLGRTLRFVVDIFLESVDPVDFLS